MNAPSKSLTLKVIQPSKLYTVLSWNVNGYSNDIHQWLLLFVQNKQPDVIFLSETKKKYNDLVTLFDEFTNYNVIINVHNPTKWHGVAMLIRKDHSYEQIDVQMNISVRKDTNSNEASIGRLIIISFNQQFFIIGSYTPNSGNDQVKLEYRTKTWDPAFFHILEHFRNLGPTMWIGDINVAVDEIDISNPKTMRKYAGFTKEERDNIKGILETGKWIDIWRYQHPNERSYTWCGNPPRPNYGMRLDNIIVSDTIMKQIIDSFTITDCPISADHIPVGVYVSPII